MTSACSAAFGANSVNVMSCLHAARGGLSYFRFVEIWRDPMNHTIQGVTALLECALGIVEPKEV